MLAPAGTFAPWSWLAMKLGSFGARDMAHYRTAGEQASKVHTHTR